jgi:hypothetical protein
MFVQSSLFYDIASYNHLSIQVKIQQVKTEWRRREREKESSGLTEGETEHWTEMKMLWVRNGCL